MRRSFVGRRSTRGARSLALAAGALLLLAAALAGCSGDSATATNPTVAGTTAPAGPAPKPETAKPSVGVSARPTVAIGQPAALLSKVSVLVGAVQQVKVKANGPGEIAGAGVQFKIKVTNGSPKAVDLGALSVNAYYGKKKPAIPSTAEDKPLNGSLKVGRSSIGTYQFRMPSSGLSSLTVEVSSGQSPYVLTFAR